jgi:hypothetical protein
MDIDFTRAAPVRQSSDAVITMGAILLAYAAFDDITTDNGTTLTVEYAALALCGAWALGVAVRLLRDGWITLGAISLVALAAGAWGQRAIGPGTAPSSEWHYVATAAAVAWFLVLSLVLLVIGWRAHREWDASIAD